MTTFQIGQTYSTRSACDHDCIVSVTVSARTAQTIKTTVYGKAKTLRVAVYNGVECVKPWGSFSMAPIVSAA